MSENMKVILWMSALNTAFWVGLHFGVGAFISRFLPTRLFDFHRPFYRPRRFERKHLAAVTSDYLRQFAEETCRTF